MPKTSDFTNEKQRLLAKTCNFVNNEDYPERTPEPEKSRKLPHSSSSSSHFPEESATLQMPIVPRPFHCV